MYNFNLSIGFGQKVSSGFSITLYGETWTNFGGIQILNLCYFHSEISLGLPRGTMHSGIRFLWWFNGIVGGMCNFLSVSLQQKFLLWEGSWQKFLGHTLIATPLLHVCLKKIISTPLPLLPILLPWFVILTITSGSQFRLEFLCFHISQSLSLMNSVSKIFLQYRFLYLRASTWCKPLGFLGLLQYFSSGSAHTHSCLLPNDSPQNFQKAFEHMNLLSFSCISYFSGFPCQISLISLWNKRLCKNTTFSLTLWPSLQSQIMSFSYFLSYQGIISSPSLFFLLISLPHKFLSPWIISIYLFINELNYQIFVDTCSEHKLCFRGVCMCIDMCFCGCVCVLPVSYFFMVLIYYKYMYN